ncbi:MAG TPA: DAK2 domain-containing protein [Methylomusa anaerophila]|uniref:DAK2 domain protein n=1 Tax=Methylomusa anaerophila TaxID=1930071 RepID=A0A348AGP9_9FIRM|nr:DAK2 domain-containing protein [Methylomusa anaerophila]BBB90247.1 DAK2 domain protein [Methylomusa anaerophila]HML89406.1 DAK2 domain-containing protein [Methylomusa anaerophila]
MQSASVITNTEVISGKDFRRMISAAYSAFLREHDYINSLNVFPVPDGDTGTNMMLTLGAVAKAIAEAPDEGIGSLSKRAADSAIMGARGNSGVILSQLLRGIARGLAGKEQATSTELGKAFQYGVLYAYRAVARPVEGTILTVAKGIAKGTRRAVRDKAPFADILKEAISAGRGELERTPELLPLLKAAGVVDAGGQGLIVFLAGCLDGLEGRFDGPEADFGRTLTVAGPVETVNISHPYCTEFIVKPCQVGFAEVKRQLAPMGDSLVLAEGDRFVKVHIHTAHPGAVLEAAITWGTLHNIKIDNMADQHRDWQSTLPAGTVATKVPDRPAAGESAMTKRSGIGVITAVAGDGLAEIMRQAGAAIIIDGGQTMNPPVEDFITAVHNGNSEKYIILPNNKNIVLAVAQVKKLLGEQVEIVPTVNVPQGLAAILAFNPDHSLSANVARMTEAQARVKAGSLTVAVRDSMVAGELAPAGAYIGVIDSNVVIWSHQLIDVLCGLVEKLTDTNTEVVTLYYGAELTPRDVEPVAEYLTEQVGPAAVEVYYGGQPHYQFIVSVE